MTEPNAVLTVRGASVPLPPVTDVSAQVTVRSSRLRVHHRTGLLSQRVTLTNTGATPLAGPLALVLTSLSPPEVTLANENLVQVNGFPAVSVPLVGDLLRPEETARVVLQFRSPHPHPHVTYTPHVWALRPSTISDAKGHFSFPVTLTPNTENKLEVFATAARGLGLTSPPARFTVAHDDQPPEVTITSGPAATIAVPEALFTFSGRDNLTPTGELEFAWRLDGGPWSAFSPATTARPTGLPQGPHLFEVKARDRAGNENPTPTQWRFTVSLLQVRISEPQDGSEVAAGPLLVRGQVEAGGAEVGVVINGVPAVVQGAAFAAVVPVTPEITNLTAVATTATGATTSHRVALTVTSAPDTGLVLLASPQSGVAPLRVVFSLLGGPLPANIELDFDGNGTVDFTGPSLEGQTFTYPQSGLYTPIVTITDAQRSRTTARTLVQVVDRAALDTLLQAKWTTLRDALRRGDIPQALLQIFGRARPRYEAIFRVLISDLPAVDTVLTDIQLLEVRRAEALYEMVRTDNGIVKSFEIRFRIDEDGLWRLWMF